MLPSTECKLIASTTNHCCCIVAAFSAINASRQLIASASSSATKRTRDRSRNNVNVSHGSVTDLKSAISVAVALTIVDTASTIAAVAVTSSLIADAINYPATAVATILVDTAVALAVILAVATIDRCISATKPCPYLESDDVWPRTVAAIASWRSCTNA